MPDFQIQLHRSGHPIRILIELEMGRYCDRVVALRDIERQLDNLQSFQHIATLDIHEQEELCQFLVELQVAQASVRDEMLLERESLSTCVKGFQGALQWKRVLELLRLALANGNDEERRFADQLRSPVNRDPHDALLNSHEWPLVFECLQNSFIEILKNSMDALIELRLSDRSQEPNLKMEITLQLLPMNRVTITIQDNGGGFPQSYLNKFETYIREKQYLREFFASQKNKLKTFGGHGRGLTILYALLLDGKLLGPQDPVDCYCPSACRDSSIAIENRNGGAFIEFISNAASVKSFASSPLGANHVEFPGYQPLDASNTPTDLVNQSVLALGLFHRRMARAGNRPTLVAAARDGVPMNECATSTPSN